MKTWAMIILAGVLALSVLAGCNDDTSRNGEPVPGYNVGDLAPAFELLDIDGNSLSLAAFSGRPLALNFWSLDCAYCVEEMPFLEDARQSEAARGDSVVILTVNMKDTAADIKNYFDSRNYGLNALVDAGLEMTRAYGVVNIPATFLIDADGIIRHVKRGPFISQGELQLNLDRVRQ